MAMDKFDRIYQLHKIFSPCRTTISREDLAPAGLRAAIAERLQAALAQYDVNQAPPA
jgi:hypothetical protein